MRRLPVIVTAFALATASGVAHAEQSTPDRGNVVDLVGRLSVYLDVEMRNAEVAAEAWLTQLATRVAPTLAVPDLACLTSEPVKGVQSSGYGWREDPIDGDRKFHKGTDFKADLGTPVYAAGPGIVIIAGVQHGYGNVIYIDHGGGLITRYGHLSYIGVHRGDAVEADSLIGKVGRTGRATGPHLHYEIRIDGRAVDPVLGMSVAEMQRTQPAALSRLAAMALLPEVQRGDRRAARHRRRDNRPERRGREKRVVPTS